MFRPYPSLVMKMLSTRCFPLPGMPHAAAGQSKKDHHQQQYCHYVFHTTSPLDKADHTVRLRVSCSAHVMVASFDKSRFHQRSTQFMPRRGGSTNLPLLRLSVGRGPALKSEIGAIHCTCRTRICTRPDLIQKSRTLLACTGAYVGRSRVPPRPGAGYRCVS